MAHVVEIARQIELRPWDMLDEGVFVRRIEMPAGWVEVGSLTYELLNLDGTPAAEYVEGETYKNPLWGGCERVRLDYPRTVIRGAHPPIIRDQLGYGF